MKKYYLFIFVCLFCLIPALFPLFQPGFFQTDDGEWMIIRFSAFHQAFRDGQFPVRFLDRLNYGFGYPVANFLYPGFMYLGETLKILGFGFVDVIKITLGICLLESTIFTYFWLARLFSRWPAVIGALFYLYAPYHLFDVYKRGSVGEVLALAIVPFILWQIERKSLFWISLSIALLILSHNILALLFIPIVFFYSYLRQKDLLFVICYLLFGFCLSAFFWIPALYDLQYTVFNTIHVSDWRQYFVNIALLGYSTVFIFISTIIVYCMKGKGKDFQMSIYFLGVGVLSIFLATNTSAIFWEVLPVSFVQFPFRFLSVTILCSAFLTAFIFSQVPRNMLMVCVISTVFLLVIDAKPFLTSIQYFNKGDSYYATNEATTTVQDEYMPLWVKEKPTAHFASKVVVFKGEGIVKNVVITGKQTIFSVDAKESVTIAVQTVYFPGWYAFIDGKQTDITYNNPKGIIQIVVPSGKHNIRVVFQETPIRLVSDGISLVAGLILMVFLIKERKKFPF